MAHWKSFYVKARNFIQYFRVTNVYHLNKWLPCSAHFPEKNNSAQLRPRYLFKLNHLCTSACIIFYVSFPTKYFACSIIYLIVILYDLTYWELKRTVELNLNIHFLRHLFNIIILRHKRADVTSCYFFQVFVPFFCS